MEPVVDDAAPACWKFKHDSKGWQPFSETDQVKMQQAHSRKHDGLHTLSLGPNEWQYEIDFKRMVQLNAKSGKERKICFHNTLVRWEFQDETDSWRPFSEEDQVTMQHAFSVPNDGSHSLDLGPRHWRYEIDFKEMVQRNAKSGKERQIRFDVASASSVCASVSASSMRASPGHLGLCAYITIDPIIQLVADCHIGFVKGSYLIDLAKRGGRFQRKQDMPLDAFATERELSQALRRRQVVALSHPWLHPKHPDPDGVHLNCLASFEAGGGSWHEGWSVEEMLWFIDFLSLPQVPRDAESDAQFKRALQNLQIIYAHDLIAVAWLTMIPKSASNPTPYSRRGWCRFEQLISTMKQYGKGHHWMPPFFNMSDWAAEEAHVPMLPDDFNALVDSLEFTSKKADLTTVKEMYLKVFEARSPTIKRLILPALTPDQIPSLAAIIPELKILKTIDISENIWRMSPFVHGGKGTVEDARQLASALHAAGWRKRRDRYLWACSFFCIEARKEFEEINICDDYGCIVPPGGKMEDDPPCDAEGVERSGLPPSYMFFRGIISPCFSPIGSILLSDSISRCPVPDVARGNKVWTPSGKATVLCVVRTTCAEGRRELCFVGHGNAAVTPNHPVLIEGQWRLPQEIAKPENKPCPFIYNFVLDHGHIIDLDGILTVTLGHGLQCAGVRHGYYGTSAVLHDLQRDAGRATGLVLRQPGREEEFTAKTLRRTGEANQLSMVAQAATNRQCGWVEQLQTLHAAAMEVCRVPTRWRQEGTIMGCIGPLHIPPPPSEIDEVVGRFASVTSQAIDSGEYNAWDIAAYTLWWVVAVHPFEDGNGRASRALAALAWTAAAKEEPSFAVCVLARLQRAFSAIIFRDRCYAALQTVNRQAGICTCCSAAQTRSVPHDVSVASALAVILRPLADDLPPRSGCEPV